MTLAMFTISIRREPVGLVWFGLVLLCRPIAVFVFLKFLLLSLDRNTMRPMIFLTESRPLALSNPQNTVFFLL